MSVRGVIETPGTEISQRRRSSVSQVPTWASGNHSVAVADTALEYPNTDTKVESPLTLAAGRTKAISPKVLRRRQILADVAAVVGGLGTALAVGASGTVDRGVAGTSAVVLVSGLAWMLCIGMNRLYLARAVARPSEELQRIAASGLAASGLILMVASVLGIHSPTTWIITSFCTVASFLVVERLIARRAFARLRASGRQQRRVAIIGTDKTAQDLFTSVEHQPELGYDVVGFISVDGRRQHETNGPIIGHLSNTEDILRATGCVGVMVSLNSVNAVQVNRVARELTDAGFHVALSTSLRDFDVTRLRPQAIGHQTLVYLEPTIRDGWRSHAKRAFDITLASIGLVLSAPIMALAAIAIRLDSKGPSLFRQVRVGRDGVEFEMIKMRTMAVDAEARRADIVDLNESDGPLFKVADDPRITRVGRFLRRTSIDELPQFWNVLRGDMSLVGPRPALPSEVAGWDEQLLERLRVLPGLTGEWQVSGRSLNSFAEYRRLDLYYVDNWSLLHDIRIVLKTFVVVVLQRGAS